MIKFRCQSCEKKIGVKDEFAGKRVKCPGCGEPVRIPQPEPAETAPAGSGDAIDALAALAGGPDEALRSVEAPGVGGADADTGPSAAGKSCPKCGAAANPSAKICVECGAGFGGLSAQNRVRAKKSAAVAGRTGFAILGGLGIALGCGVIWALVAKVTGYELGYLAWGLGLGVGVGVALIARRGGVLVGLGAVFVSFLGWLTAKALIAVWVIHPMFSEEVGGYMDGTWERDNYIVQRVRAEGGMNDALYEAWEWEEFESGQEEQIDTLINTWVQQNGEPPPNAMMREGVILGALAEEGTMDEALHERWFSDELNAEQYEQIDTLVADYVAANGEPDLEAAEEVADAVVGGLIWVISFIGALSLFDLIWVPLMAFSAYKTAASAEVTVNE